MSGNDTRGRAARLAGLNVWALAVAVPVNVLWNEAVRVEIAPPPRPAPLHVPVWMDLGASLDEFGVEYACAGYRFEPYRVRVDDGVLTAGTYEPVWEPRQDDLPYDIDFAGALDQLPPVPGEVDVPSQEAWVTRYAREHARRLVHHVADGWLIGFDGGEYGGSLWWYPRSPGRGVKLSDHNVRSIVVGREATSAVVFVGLGHQGRSAGQALRLARSGADGGWRTTDTQIFRGTPGVHVTTADGTLVATTHSVERLPGAGSPLVLYDAGRIDLGEPLSLAVAETGEIAVGMRHFVLMLRPGKAGYTSRWYVPMPCGIEPLWYSIEPHG